MTTDEAISELGYMLDYHLRTNGHHNVTKADEALTMAIEALKREQWIPCSERLPEGDYPTVEVTIEFAAVNGNRNPNCTDIATYHRGLKAWDNKFGIKVIAWKPLPEPYKDNNVNGLTSSLIELENGLEKK